MSPQVLTVANFGATSAGRAEQELQRLPASQRGHDAGPTPPQPGAGGGFHTDVEYEPLPINVSMFLVQAAPTARTAPGGNGVADTWVADTGEGDTAKPGARFFRQGRANTSAGEEGQRRRHLLKPLNGETAFVDLAAAFAALPAAERATLARLQVSPTERTISCFIVE